MIRVRFAPSPTGALHIGGLRTALYNYLFAKKHGGEFILRIEDTDSQRFVPGSENHITEALKWCGLQPDEGPEQGGPHAPYRQSERKSIYKQYADYLVNKGCAYFAFDTAEELETMRLEAEKQGGAFAYNYTVRNELKTSLKLSKEEVNSLISSGHPFVIRFYTPENKIVNMSDLIRGEINVNTSTLDDKVLYKSTDELPTYHLANIVDDHLMQISHVIRGEEWLPSLALHYLLYEAFDWQDSRPKFAHLPLLLKPQGQGKLSKRDGDKFGFPVFPLEWKDPKSGDISMGYREEGYFPQAVLNMLALLGWNPGTEQEIFSLDELCESFSLEKVNKSGARFNPDKARWFNAQYIKQSSDEELAFLIEQDIKNTFLSNSDFKQDFDLHNTTVKIIALFKDRVNFLSEIINWANILYRSPDNYKSTDLQKFGKEENREMLKDTLNFMLNQWGNTDSLQTDAADMENKTLAYMKSKSYPIGSVMSLFRLLLIGQSQGPNVFPICAFIGLKETENRLNMIQDLC